MLVTVDSDKASDILTGYVIDLVTSDALYTSCDILHEMFVGCEHAKDDDDEEFSDCEHPTEMTIRFLELVPVPNVMITSSSDRVRITKSINELLSIYYTLDSEHDDMVEQITDAVSVCLCDGGYEDGDVLRDQICGDDSTIISDMVEQYSIYCSMEDLDYSVPLTHFNGKLAVVVGV